MKITHKYRLLLILVLFFTPFTFSFSQKYITLETSAGNIIVRLYKKTKLHRDNFLHLVDSGYYNGVLFHRVISGFMIQSGDPNSKNAKAGDILGEGDTGYTIPAEIYPSLFHKRGAVAAARTSDDVNPEKASSGSQFYIVQGTILTPGQLNSLERTGKHEPFTNKQRKIYTSIGGSPHLDNSYTVFGEVIEGFDVVEIISLVDTDDNNRPVNDIVILKAYVSK